MFAPIRSYAITVIALLNAITLPLNAETLASIEVSQQAFSHERQFDGVVEAINQTTVSAQTGGRVIEIKFDIDDVVKKDDILIKISDDEQSASATQAAAAVSQAGAQLTLATNNFKRFETLYKSQTISKSQLDDAKTALDSARANLKTSLAAKDQAQKQVDYTVVRAPYSGIVTARSVELGETVAPGQPLMSGFSTTALRIRTEVPNRFAQNIEAEQGVDIILDTEPPSRLHSTALTVFPYANTQSNSVTVRIDLPENQADVYPGMLLKIAFKTATDNCIAIPQSAIFNRSEITGVYVLEGENIHLRRVSLGQPILGEDNETNVKVLSGLKVGEQIALDPIAAIKQMKARQPSIESH